MQEKAIQDSKQNQHWSSYILFWIGILSGIVLVSMIKNDGFYWAAMKEPIIVTVLLTFSIFCIYRGKQKVIHQS